MAVLLALRFTTAALHAGSVMTASLCLVTSKEAMLSLSNWATVS